MKIMIFILLSISLYAHNIKKTPSNINYYKEYVNYLVNNKNIPLKSIEASLNSSDRYMKYYEALLKVSYNVYQEKNINKQTLKLVEFLRNTDKLKNNFEAVMFNDIELSLNVKTENRIPSFYFCEIQFHKNNLIQACKNNFITLRIINDKRISNILELDRKNAEKVYTFLNKEALL